MVFLLRLLILSLLCPAFAMAETAALEAYESRMRDSADIRSDFNKLHPTRACHSLGLSPELSFPASTVRADGQCKNTQCTSYGYRHGFFRNIEDQNYKTGQKVYFVPYYRQAPLQGGVDSEMGPRVFVGWIMYRVQKVLQDYDPASHGNVRRAETSLKNSGFTSPVLVQVPFEVERGQWVDINTYVPGRVEYRTKMVYENCTKADFFLPSHTFSPNDLAGQEETWSWFGGPGKTREIFHRWTGSTAIRDVYYGPNDTPVFWGYLAASSSEIEDRISRLSTSIEAMRFVRNIAPGTGSVFSISECANSRDLACWLDASATVAGDVAIFFTFGLAKVPGAISAARKGGQVLQSSAMLSESVARANNLVGAARVVNYGIGAAQLTASAIYLSREDYLKALGSAVGGSVDAGFVEYGIRQITSVRLGRTLAETCPAIELSTRKSPLKRMDPPTCPGKCAASSIRQFARLSEQEQIVFRDLAVKLKSVIKEAREGDPAKAQQMLRQLADGDQLHGIRITETDLVQGQPTLDDFNDIRQVAQVLIDEKDLLVDGLSHSEAVARLVAFSFAKPNFTFPGFSDAYFNVGSSAMSAYSSRTGVAEIGKFKMRGQNGAPRELNLADPAERMLATISAQASIEEVLHLAGQKFGQKGYYQFGDKYYYPFSDLTVEFACWLKNLPKTDLTAYGFKPERLADPTDTILEADILAFLIENGFDIVSDRLRNENYPIRRAFVDWYERFGACRN